MFLPMGWVVERSVYYGLSPVSDGMGNAVPPDIGVSVRISVGSEVKSRMEKSVTRYSTMRYR